MMRNADYEHEGMVITLRQRADELHQHANRLGWTTGQLKMESHGGYHTEHLDETLDNMVKSLHDMADKLERLREYTQYPGLSVQQRMNERRTA